MQQGDRRHYIGMSNRFAGINADSNVDSLYFLATLINYLTVNCTPGDKLKEYDQYLQSIGFKAISEFCPSDDKRHRRLRRYVHKDRIAYDEKPYRIELLLHPKTFKFAYGFKAY
jgi:hypothetical protein